MIHILDILIHMYTLLITRFSLHSLMLSRNLQRESCVIVGRCADYALEDNPYAVSATSRQS
ncbi:MAG: hypothetical protein ACLT33_13580 [Lachnospira pectinoschiza]